MGETESGWRTPLGAVSCLMFGYRNRDESYTSNILDEERRQWRGGGGGDGGGGSSLSLFPKGPERLDVRHVCLRAIKLKRRDPS